MNNMTRSILLPYNIITLLLSILLFSCTDPQITEKSFQIDPPSESLLSASIIPEDTPLAAGDALTVEVWGHDDLSKELVIDATGFIYYPFIGKEKASGHTIEQLQILIADKLSRYYVAPKVTITPGTLASQHYFVLGEVNSPGRQSLTAPTSVLEVVASAGGPTGDAGDSVILLRKTKNKLLILSLPIRYKDLTANNLQSATTLVKARDILFLAPSTIADVETFMKRLDNILAPILSLERGIIFWPELIKAMNGTEAQNIFISQ